MKRNLVQLWEVRCLVACLALSFGFTASAEKAWKSPTNGFWGDGANWSGNLPPDITSFIQITNANTKTVTIDAAAPAATLTVQMLTMSALPGETNTLLLSDAGATNPLVFQTGLTLNDGGAIRITNSALAVQITFGHVNLDGSTTLDSGLITFGDNTVTARVGRATSGSLIINGGVVQGGTMTVGGLTNSQGLVTMNGGSLNVSSLLSIARNAGTTGTVAVLGGQLAVLSDDTRIGDAGVGQMIVSNATALLTNLVVGRDPLSRGTLALQNGGVVVLSNDLTIARFGGSTGIVTVAGGQLMATGMKILVGRDGAGQLTISSGAVQASRLLVAANPTNTVTGTFAMSGGNLSLSSELLVGSLGLSSGEVMVTGGVITATNGSGAGAVNIPSGNLTLNGGTITADSLLLTNSAGQMVFSSGVLDSGATTVSNGSPFVVGDGTSPATFRLLGGTHSFANGLTISSNASLSGCGTIIGSIINHGTISTNCGSGPVPPSITQQPVSLTVTQGNNATFTVMATGDAPLAYQWRFASNNLSGATSSSYTVASAQAANAGNYDVVVSNNSGSVTSAVATLTVRIPPFITQQPISLTATQGDNVTFTVVATGDPPLSYQWRFGVPGTGGGDIAGATSATLQLSKVQTTNAGNYRVVVHNASGSATSAVATLSVLLPPVITLQPQSQTVAQGTNASFTVAATGTAPLGYQWYFGVTPLIGQTSNSLSLINVQLFHTGNYTVVVTNRAGSATSAPASLRVLAQPTITKITHTGTTASVSFTTVSGLTYTLEYKNSLNNSTWTASLPSVTGTGNVVTVNDPSATVPARLYRVRTE